MMNYAEWLHELKGMDRSLDSKEKMKVWCKYAWNKPLGLPTRRIGEPMRHFGSAHDGEIIQSK